MANRVHCEACKVPAPPSVDSVALLQEAAQLLRSGQALAVDLGEPLAVLLDAVRDELQGLPFDDAWSAAEALDVARVIVEAAR